MYETGTHGARVKASILQTGLALWREDIASVSARRIGKRLGMSHGAVLYHFGSAEEMKHALADEAVRVGDRTIVPQLITMKHPAVECLDEADRRRYLDGC